MSLLHAVTYLNEQDKAKEDSTNAETENMPEAFGAIKDELHASAVANGDDEGEYAIYLSWTWWDQLHWNTPWKVPNAEAAGPEHVSIVYKSNAEKKIARTG